MEGKTNFSQIYILMVILLILSQDDVNNEAIQKIVSENWCVFSSHTQHSRFQRSCIISLGLQRGHY